MSNNKTLTINNDIFNPSLAVLAKVEFSENSLEFPAGIDAITDDEHKELWPLLLRCNESSKWWIGDYLANCEYEVTDSKTGKVTKAMKVKLYEYMEETTGYGRSYLKQMKSVASRIPKDKRTKLSFQHHLDAIGICNGEPTILFAILHNAEKEKSSVSKLRSDARTIVAGSGANRQTIDSTDADNDFAEVVSLLQKLKSIINRDNLDKDQLTFISKEITEVAKLL